jgi:hypothetical protein
MSREALERLVQRWMDEPAFRAEVRRDLEGAIERAGYELDEDEWSALRDTDWTRPDEELRTRMADVAGRASPPL